MYTYVQECFPCHPLCDGCHGPASGQCNNCTGYLEAGDCVESCPEDNYADELAKTCTPCHYQCLACYGLTEADCTMCRYMKLYDDVESHTTDSPVSMSLTAFVSVYCMSAVVEIVRRWNWNCCDRQTCSVVIWKHFCLILFTGTRIRIDSVMRHRSSSRGHNTSASVSYSYSYSYVCGTAAEKLLSPSHVRVLGTVDVNESDDRNDRRPISVMSWQSSQKYCGSRPCNVPPSLRRIDSHRDFRAHLKTYLFQRAFDFWHFKTLLSAIVLVTLIRLVTERYKVTWLNCQMLT